VDTSYNDIFSTKGLNSLTYNDPYAKLCFTSMIASQCQKKVIYIDLDTMFAAYAKSDLILSLRNTKYINKTINIYLPTEDRFESILKEVIEDMYDSSIVIFDSVNNFYNMYYKKIDINSGRGLGNINHLLSIFLMLLLKHGTYLNVPILATSMIRYKKYTEWIKTPTSRRLLHKKSIVKLNVEMINEDDLSLEIIAHPTRTSEKIIFQNLGVKFDSNIENNA
jgi:hypothetical protein